MRVRDDGAGARARAPDRGAAAIEYAALLPVVIVLLLLAFQAYTASTTVERIENAARTGARVAGQHYDPERCPAAALASMPSWLNDHQVDGGRTGGGVYCHVRAKLPLLWKGVPLDITVNRTVTMPLG